MVPNHILVLIIYKKYSANDKSIRSSLYANSNRSSCMTSYGVKKG